MNVGLFNTSVNTKCVASSPRVRLTGKWIAMNDAECRSLKGGGGSALWG